MFKRVMTAKIRLTGDRENKNKMRTSALRVRWATGGIVLYII